MAMYPCLLQKHWPLCPNSKGCWQGQSQDWDLSFHCLALLYPVKEQLGTARVKLEKKGERYLLRDVVWNDLQKRTPGAGQGILLPRWILREIIECLFWETFCPFTLSHSSSNLSCLLILSCSFALATAALHTPALDLLRCGEEANLLDRPGQTSCSCELRKAESQLQVANACPEGCTNG